VREALVELASFGLVELLPNRGAVAQPFGPQEIREISQIRRLLEVEASPCACGRVPAAELSAVEQELRRLEVLPRDQAWDHSARAVDTKLHGLIADSCGSRRLAAEVGRYLLLFRALRDVSHQRDAWTNFSRSNDVPELLAIVVPLQECDAEAAAQAMERHVRSAAMKLEEVILRWTGRRRRPQSLPGKARPDIMVGRVCGPTASASPHEREAITSRIETWLYDADGGGAAGHSRLRGGSLESCCR
jgi:DNA-binding GntR family transcriptional regulator